MRRYGMGWCGRMVLPGAAGWYPSGREIRPELAIAATRPRLFHLRTQQGRHEIDLLAELAGRQVLGIEVKAQAAPDGGSARHLSWLRDRLGERFSAGVVLHTGQRTYGLGERIVAAPICTLWAYSEHELPTGGEGGLRPGVALDDSASLLDLMDGEGS